MKKGTPLFTQGFLNIHSPLKFLSVAADLELQPQL